MDPREVLTKVEEALGVERERVSIARAATKRKRARSATAFAPSRKRAAAEAAEDRARTSRAWRTFAFSVAYSALHPKKADRVVGPKEKDAVAVMRKQRGWIGSSVRARWAAMGPAGHEFARAFVARYERSVVDVMVEPIASPEDPAPVADLHCAIEKRPVGASAARRVTVRYRGIGGAVREAVPAVVSRDWAERISAWFDLVNVDDRIAERAVETLAAHVANRIPIPPRTLAKWRGKTLPAAAEMTAQSEDLFDRQCRAVSAWLSYPPPPNVWPGWFK